MKSNKWNQNIIKFLVRQKFVSFLKYIYYTYYLYICMQSFSTMLDKALRISEKRRDGEIRRHKLN